MRYSIALVSAKRQHESSIGLHVSPPTWTSLPLPSPSHPSGLLPSSHLSSLSHTANSYWLSVLHLVMYVFMLPSYEVLREIDAQEKIENKKSRATLFIYILYNCIFIIITWAFSWLQLYVLQLIGLETWLASHSAQKLKEFHLPSKSRHKSMVLWGGPLGRKIWEINNYSICLRIGVQE